MCRPYGTRLIAFSNPALPCRATGCAVPAGLFSLRWLIAGCGESHRPLVKWPAALTDSGKALLHRSGSTGIHLQTCVTRITALSGCPTFAPAYECRKGWAKPYNCFVPAAESNRKKTYSAHVRWCKRRAPVQSCRERNCLWARPAVSHISRKTSETPRISCTQLWKGPRVRLSLRRAA
jgi:hypothetical protein